MDNYLLIGTITFFLSLLFSMGGTGSGIALIPILHFLGFDFTQSKAMGLFAGASTTVTSSIMNLKRGLVELKSVIPIAITMLIFAPLGAYLNRYINQDIVKILFMFFLFYTASMMLFGKKKTLFHIDSSLIFLIVGAFVGLLAGILGVGGWKYIDTSFNSSWI